MSKKKPGKVAIAAEPEVLKEKPVVKDLSDKLLVELAQKDSLAWKKELIKSPAHAKELLGTDADALKGALCLLFNLKVTDVDLFENVLLDCYCHVVDYANLKKIHVLQFAALFTIIHEILEHCKAGMSLADNVMWFQETMRAHSGPTPYDSSGKLVDFTFAQASMTAEYVMTGPFQHYRMYSQLFSTPRKPHTKQVQSVVVQVPAFVAALDEAIDERDYKRFVDPNRQPEPTSEESSLPSLTAEQARIITKRTMENYLRTVETEYKETLQKEQESLKRRLEALESVRDEKLVG